MGQAHMIRTWRERISQPRLDAETWLGRVAIRNNDGFSWKPENWLIWIPMEPEFFYLLTKR